MEAQYKTLAGRLVIKLEAGTQKELVKRIAEAQEVFEEPDCGLCGCPDLRFRVRTVERYEYYELRCQNPECRAKLDFGQHQDGGTLFPQRKGKNGDWLPHHGWVKWEASTGQLVA